MGKKNTERLAVLFLGLLFLLFLVSCQTDTGGKDSATPGPVEEVTGEGKEEGGHPEGGGKNVPGERGELAGKVCGDNGEEAALVQHEERAGETGNEKEEKLYLGYKPNELGEIMILMYHEISYPEGEWRRTPENLRRDLETLYRLGYRAVSLTDAVRGNIHIPAGTSPVVLTFDDGNRGNFNYLEQLVIDPDCAVAILESFAAEYPDFGLAATFFIYYPNPFRQPEYIQEKLSYLVKRGFEIGNHTYSHANLSRLSPEEIQKELALHIKKTREYLPGYDVNSLSLPYGAYPRQHPELVREGYFDGISYSHKSVLLVGAGPAPSPFHKKFDPYRLLRIRASEMKTEGVGLYDWLDYFEDNPHLRYISDGVPGYITAPKSLQEHLDESRTGGRIPRFYTDSTDP